MKRLNSGVLDVLDDLATYSAATICLKYCFLPNKAWYEIIFPFPDFNDEMD